MKRKSDSKRYRRLLVISTLITFTVFLIYLLNFPFTITGNAVINSSVLSNSTDFSGGTFTGTFILDGNIRLNKTLNPIGEYNDSLGRAYGVFVSGDFAYVTATDTDTLTIINISNKTNPVFMSNYTSSNLPFSLNTPYTVFVSGDFAYVISNINNSLTILNVTNKSNPIATGEYNNSDPPYSLDGAYGVFVSGDFAYVTSRDDDFLTILNISNKSNPSPIGDYNVSGPFGAPQGVFVLDSYAYVAVFDDDNLTILNISNKSNPSLAGYYSNIVPPYVTGEVRHVYVSGNYAYITTECCGSEGNALTILDITDKSNPFGVGNYSVGGSRGIFAQGDYVYVTSTTADFVYILDASNKSNLTLLDTYDNDVAPYSIDFPPNVFVLNGYAYIPSNLDNTLTILEISSNGTYESPITNATYNAKWINFSWNESEFSGTNLSMLFRSCDDSACSGETYGQYYEDSPVNLDLANNMYFQYKANFLTSNISFTPQLNSTQVFYSDDITPPIINLTNYINGTAKNNNSNLTLNISLEDSGLGLTNSICTISINETNQTISTIDGWCNSSSINLTNLLDGNYTVKVYANDSINNVGLNDSFVIVIESNPPNVNFTCSPSSVVVGATVICTCSATDSGVGINVSSISNNLTIVTTETGGFSVSGCSAEDLAGNSASVTGDYTVTAAATTSTNGDGGSAPTTEYTIKKVNTITKISPGEAISLTSFTGTGVKEIIIEVNQETSNAKIKVFKYDSKPTNVSKEASGKIYGYLEINVENLDTNLEKATVRFEVNKTWFSDNNLEKGDLEIFKFDENSEKWDSLDSVYESDNGNYVYSVELDSFSFFAIAEKVKIPIISDIVDVVTDSYEKVSSSKLGIFLWWNVIFMLIVGIVIVVMLILQERNRILLEGLTQKAGQQSNF